MALGANKGTWTFTANSIVANNQATLATGVNTVARGDLIVVVIGEQTGNTSTGASDTLGNTYTAATVGTLGGGVSGRAFYTIVTNAGTNTNINVAATASANNVAIVAASYEGSFSAIDANPANNNNTDNSSPFTCPATGTLAQQVEIIIAWMVQNTANTLTATSPNLKDNQANSQSVVGTALGHQVVNSTSTVSPAWTGTNPTGSQQGTISFRASDLPENQYSWPVTPAPEYAIQLRTSIAFRMPVADAAAPFNQENWPLTPWPEYPAQLRTWVAAKQLEPEPAPPEDSQPRAPHFTRPWELKGFIIDVPYNVALYGTPVVVEYPFKQTDWPLTPAPQQLPPSITASYNPNLVGQDRLPFRQMDWPLPVPPHRNPELASWIDRVKLLLAVPFKQTDWPINRGPLQPDRSFTQTFPRVLIGQDFLPVGTDYTDRPFVAPTDGKTWIQSVNLALNVAPATPFNQEDWPTPRGPEQPIRSLTVSYNLNLIGQDRLPVGTEITDLPPQPAQQPTPILVASYNKNLIGQDQFPPGAEITDLPPRDAQRAIELRTWIYNTSLALQAGPVVRPFAQTDWPIPRAPDRPIDILARGFPLVLRGQDRLPVRQQEWPLPGRAAQPDRSFGTSFNRNLTGQDRLPIGRVVTDIVPAHMAARPAFVVDEGTPFPLYGGAAPPAAPTADDYIIRARRRGRR